jgi:hypothetical protein
LGFMHPDGGVDGGWDGGVEGFVIVITSNVT